MYLFINPLATGVGEPVPLRPRYGPQTSAVLQEVYDGAKHTLLLEHIWQELGKSDEMAGCMFALFVMFAIFYEPFHFILKDITTIEIKVLWLLFPL